MRPYGGWLNFRYLEMNGRYRKALEFPSRERVLVRKALERIRVNYRECVPFFNPLYSNPKNGFEGSITWMDFFIYKDGLMAIHFHPAILGGGLSKRVGKIFDAKVEYMKQRGIPCLVLRRNETSQSYEMKIRMLIHKRSAL